MTRVRLSDSDINQALENLSGWKRSECGAFLDKEFDFSDFKTAWMFMSHIADKAEEMDHHPNWSNVYSVVHIALSTHDVEGITKLDIELAEFINFIADDPFGYAKPN